MTNQDAIYVLEEALYAREDLNPSKDDDVDAVEMAMAALKRQMWIPVTEALPETNGEYLVVVENDAGKRQRKVSSFTTNGVCYSWGIETSPMYTVKAWTELPPIWEG